MLKDKILVIDDSKSVRAAVRFALRKMKLDIIDAEDGAKALEVLNSEKELKLAICDVNMPNLNGIELLEVLNKKQIATDVVFLMLTTANTRDMVTKGAQLGVNLDHQAFHSRAAKDCRGKIFKACLKELTEAQLVASSIQ